MAHDINFDIPDSRVDPPCHSVLAGVMIERLLWTVLRVYLIVTAHSYQLLNFYENPDTSVPAGANQRLLQRIRLCASRTLSPCW